MYEAVYADPDEDGSLSRLVETADAYGFDGLVVRNATEGSLAEELSAAREAAPIDVVGAGEITANDRQRASGAVGTVRHSQTTVIVRGGSTALNRFAVENEKVDVLSRPMAADGDVNHVLAKAAVANSVRIEFDLGPVLRESGGRRVRVLQSLGKLFEIVDYYDAPYVVSATPADRFELRAPRELAAVGEQIGLSRKWIEEGLAEWDRLAARNRRIQSDSFIEPGVERGRYDEDR